MEPVTTTDTVLPSSEETVASARLYLEGVTVTNRQKVGIGALVLIVVAAIVLVVVPPDGDRQRGDAIAVVHLSGQIQDGAAGPFGGGVINPDLVRERLEQVEGSPRVRAVVLRLNTPGGSPAASQEIVGLLEGLELPLVISMGDVAASGGYYIAAGADRIVANPATLTGSIGVIWTQFDITGLLDELGIEINTITSGEHKDMLIPGRFDEDGARILQAISDEMYDDFVRAVADGRGMDEDVVRELATGQPYTGRQAFDLGLVDLLGGLDEAVSEAEELAGIEDANVIEVRPGFFEQFFGPGLGGSRLGALRDRLIGGTAVDIRRLLEDGVTPRFRS